MGLDSVELLLSIEKHFGITIGDTEAAKTITVQDLAHLVARHRTVVPNGRDVRDEVCNKLKAALPPGSVDPVDGTPFKELMQELDPKRIWSAFASTGLKMPDLPPRDRAERYRNPLLTLLPKWGSGRSITDLTYGQVVDAITAHNHRALIDPLKPSSNYEILAAVIGVSSESIGVPELEIRPTDSFVNDLGID